MATVKVVEALMPVTMVDYCLSANLPVLGNCGRCRQNGRRGSLFTCNLTIHGVQHARRLSGHLADNPVHRAAPF